MRLKCSVFLVVLTLLSSTTSVTFADIIGYWRFEEGSAGAAAVGVDSILDSSTAGNSGNPNGSPIYSADVAADFVGGVANELSLNFDGTNDFVLVETDTALDSADAFTVEFWFRSGGTGGGQDLLVDKSHGFGDVTGWFFQSNPGTGIIDFGLGNGSGFPVVSSGDDLFDDQWHHLAGTYDGNEIELFVNGISQGTNNAGTYVANDRDIRFGNARNNGRFFAGSLDEVRIANRVLAPSEFLIAVPEPSSSCLWMAVIFTIGFQRRRRG